MHILGIYLDGEKIYLSILDKKKNIRCFKYKKGDKFFKKSSYIISGISSKNILIKKKIIELNDKDLKKSLPFQETVVSSFDKKEVIVNTIISNQWEKKRELSFYLTTKKCLEEHIKKMEEIGVEPDIITAVCQAQMRFFKFFFPKKNEAFLLHVDSCFSHITLIENGLPKSTSFIKVGGKDLIKEDYHHFQNDKNLAFFNALSRFFYSYIEKGKKIPIMVTGDITQREWIEEIVQVKNNEFISEILKVENNEFNSFAISIGFALEFLEKDRASLQFRKGEYVSRRYLKKVGFCSLAFLFFSFLPSFLLFFKGDKILEERENILKKNFFLLKKMEGFNEEEGASKSLSKIKISLEKMKEKIEKEKKTFLPLPLAPKVSFLLNSFYKNPFFKDVEIVFFDYQVKDYPDLNNKNKKYKIKVSLHLQIEDKMVAKKFYENILKQEIVDKKENIIWEEEEDLYKISFFLRSLKIKDLYYED